MDKIKLANGRERNWGEVSGVQWGWGGLQREVMAGLELTHEEKPAMQRSEKTAF